MHKLKPINLESEEILIHPLRESDLLRVADLKRDLLEMLGDNSNTEFIPEQRIKDEEKLADRITAIVFGYHTNQMFTHFITDKRRDKIIGSVSIITPERAQANYQFGKYDWMLEYFLHKDYWGKGIMTGIINAICNNLKEQGIPQIAAMCDKNNYASIRVLEKIGFRNMGELNIKQDYYLL